VSNQEWRQTESVVAVAPASRVRRFLRGRERRRLLGRILVAMLGLGVASLIVVFRLRPQRTAEPVTLTQPLPENAQQSVAGYTITRSEGGHPVFTVHAERTLALKDNQGTTLDGVEVEIFGRTGDQHDLLTTRRCQYNQESGSLACAGRVAMELNAPPGARREDGTVDSPSNNAKLHGHQPLYLETSAISYSQNDSQVTTAAPVKWRYGPATGSAVGLTYATREGWLEMARNVEASLPVQETGQQGGRTRRSVLKLKGAAMRYDRSKQQVDLAGPVEITEGARQVTAGHAVLDLDSQNRLTQALFDQAVSARDSSGRSPLTVQAETVNAELDPASGELRQLKAAGNVQAKSAPAPGVSSSSLATDNVQIDFTGAHFRPDHGVASGDVNLAVEAPERPPQSPASQRGPAQSSLSSEDLLASELEFSFHSDGRTLKQAHTVGPGKLVLAPSNSKSGRKVATAGQFLMAFDSFGRLASVRGLSPTQLVFEPAPGSPPGTMPIDSRADTLEARLDPVTQALEWISQSGHYQLLDGDRRANAERADYSAGPNVMTLTGKPRLADPETHISADHFVVRLDTGTAEGTGHVNSTHFGPLPGESANPAPARDSAGITNVIADTVIANRANNSVHYEGHVRAWQGADVIESPSLDIYRAERRIVAGPGVVTSNLAPTPERPGRTTLNAASNRAGEPPRTATPEEKGSGRQPGAIEPVTIHADRLEYFDARGEAIYRGHVQLDASGATLLANRLEAYFTAESPGQPSKLDHAVAEGHVTVVQPGRRAAGNRADYVAATGKIVMTGGPPTLYDAQRGFATGQTLTFFTGNDTLLVGGGKGSRALSKYHQSQ